MAIDIMIDVKNLLTQDDQQNIIHFQTRGYLYQKEQATYLQYEEGAEGLEGVQTTLKLEKDRVTLIRHGNLSMRQVFSEGLNDISEYHTQYGSLPLTTSTERLEHALGLEEGRIRIFYDLYLDEELSSKNALEITYQSMGEE